MASRAAGGIVKAVGAGVFSLLMVVLTLIAIEGIASWLVIIVDVEFNPTSTNEYDAELGWTAKASTTIPDFYGSGRSVVTNAQGFRSEVEFTPQLPEGMQRIVCSGDSFAFGSGVGDGETWCDLLAAGDGRVESVNMGLPGYGIGQSMLRYEQQTRELEHTLHVFSFIGSDIPRAIEPSHNGYGRPVIRVEDGTLSVVNVPVPRRLNTLARNAKRVADAMRTVEVITRLRRRLASDPPARYRKGQVAAVSSVAREIFLRVQASTGERGARAALVFLPTLDDYAKPKQWEEWLVSAMPGLDVVFVNLAPDLRKVHEDLVESYFIPVGQPGQTHYTRTGNRWAAETLRRHLIAAGVLSESH
jgi:hypothetical protein